MKEGEARDGMRIKDEVREKGIEKDKAHELRKEER